NARVWHLVFDTDHAVIGADYLYGSTRNIRLRSEIDKNNDGKTYESRFYFNERKKTVYPLLLKQLWHTPLANASEQEIIYRDRLRLSYRQVYERINQGAAALAAEGVRQDEVIAVMDHDSHRYLECYFFIPMYGATLM